MHLPHLSLLIILLAFKKKILGLHAPLRIYEKSYYCMMIYSKVAMATYER